MKTKSFRNGKTRGQTYLKAVGSGYEAGFTFGGKPVFVGNFIHSGEASRWYATMNRELRSFGRKYRVGQRYSSTWFQTFMNHHLYNSYYFFLNRLFKKYQMNFKRAVNRDMRKYKRMTRTWKHDHKTPFLRAA
jgi:hypothetical protein